MQAREGGGRVHADAVLVPPDAARVDRLRGIAEGVAAQARPGVVVVRQGRAPWGRVDVAHDLERGRLGGAIPELGQLLADLLQEPLTAKLLTTVSGVVQRSDVLRLVLAH